MVTEPARVFLGDVEVTRVPEYAGRSPATPGFLFPDSSPAYWAANAGWLDPDFYDAAKGTLRTVLHTWLIRSQGMIILLDTGAGNGKERPYAPVYAHHDTAYLDNLRAACVSPEDVDIVINTHLHVDHVGWNTRLEGRDWVPTFPNARYLICEPDFLFWDPIRTPRPPGDGNQNVFEDSVQPLQRAGWSTCGTASIPSTPSWCCGPSPATPPARLCSGCSPAASAPCSSATSSTRPRRSLLPTSTAASARIRPWHAPRAAACWPRPPTGPCSCFPGISAAIRPAAWTMTAKVHSSSATGPILLVSDRTTHA